MFLTVFSENLPKMIFGRVANAINNFTLMGKGITSQPRPGAAAHWYNTHLITPRSRVRVHLLLLHLKREFFRYEA
jgi:hypothetical protein